MTKINENLETIPGIATHNLGHLKAVGVETSYQLFGKFLEFKKSGVSQEVHCDSFFQWLHDDAKITSHREAIVEAVASRLSIMMPDIYDQNMYHETAPSKGKKVSAKKGVSEPAEMVEG